jgi:L-ascorbate metabolism protein UlaG (beta-lactamase superfamily)
MSANWQITGNGDDGLTTPRTFASQTADLPAGTNAPHTGVYVVSHNHPAHACPHEVAIVAPMVLPKCHLCDDVRFSLKGLLAEPIKEHEFFR